ncbi:MAG: DUF4968 domain-containing protein, partial [Planctomycetes bacterium]|nr:DUF4968 domain-containing protein [Planctomycetota bacterium]
MALSLANLAKVAEPSQGSADETLDDDSQGRMPMSNSKRQFRDIRRANGDVLRVEPITPFVFRLRLRPDASFREAALVRYGVVRSEWPEFEVETDETSETVTFRTRHAALAVSKADGRMAFRDEAGRI